MSMTPATTIIPAPSQNPLQDIKPILNERNELDLASLDFGERLEKLSALIRENKYNIPLLEPNVLAQMPAGTSLQPIPIPPRLEDAWHGQDARNMKLKEGMVEPKADWIIKLGNMLGVKLKEEFAGVTEETGTKMFSVRYTASLMLPSGELITAENEGKDQELYNSSGKQAHVIESTRKKAKRNAIKNLLGIPTQMPQEQFLKPWILLRPVFTSGVSVEADRIIERNRALSDQAIQALYANRQLSSFEDGPGFEHFKNAIESASNPEELEVVRKRLAAARMTTDERSQLGVLFKNRQTLLSTGEVSAANVQEAY